MAWGWQFRPQAELGPQTRVDEAFLGCSCARSSPAVSAAYTAAAGTGAATENTQFESLHYFPPSCRQVTLRAGPPCRMKTRGPSQRGPVGLPRVAAREGSPRLADGHTEKSGNPPRARRAELQSWGLGARQGSGVCPLDLSASFGSSHHVAER